MQNTWHMRKHKRRSFHRFGLALSCCMLALGALALSGCDDGDKVDPSPSEATVVEGIYAAFGEIQPRHAEQWAEVFARGEAVAARSFTPEEGLGPEFNVTSCGHCHERPVLGGGAPRYRDFWIHGQRLNGAYIDPPADDQGFIVHSFSLEEDGARPAINGRDNSSFFARRNPVPIFGTGLIAEIDPEAILANADPEDEDGDGISGRVNCPGGFIGRFGRKAQTANIEGFIRGPIFNHMQISTDPLPEDLLAELPVPSNTEGVDLTRFQCPPDIVGLSADVRRQGQKQAAAPGVALVDEDDVPDPELPPSGLFDVVAWNMLLAVPAPDAPTAQTERGGELFEAVGCASCHIPALESPDGLVPLYSDLLLHDMGEEMADGLEMVFASGSEFRTQPLWGVAAVAPYLHDGRADTLDEAIRWHGGEARAARERYVALDEEDRGAVIAFLESLGGNDQHTDGLLAADEPLAGVGEPGGPQRPLDEAEAQRFLEARALFDRDFHLDTGLGTTFNGDSCRACHFEPVFGGAGPLDVNVARHGAWVDDEFVEPGVGTILHRFGPPGAFRPDPEEGTNVYEMRQTPSLLGLGLIDGISEATIRANADPDDADEDGIRGRVHELPDGRVGRFGWKAQIGTVREFVRDALSMEMGLTLEPEVGALPGVALDEDDFADPEAPVEFVDELSFYIGLLAAPAPRASEPEGEQLFEDVGCASCHIPELEGASGLPVPLYSDLLLHDVQMPDYRGVPEGDAGHREFRTPPLWGVGQTAPYMHDGLATTLEDAVLRHDGSATTARESYEALSADEQAALLRFLEGL